jgi:hypothetical protein
MIRKSMIVFDDQVKGEDNNGLQYESLEQMWKCELDPSYKQSELDRGIDNKRIGSKQNWYKKSIEFWNEQTTDDDGVLGGYAELNKDDLIASKLLL